MENNILLTIHSYATSLFDAVMPILTSLAEPVFISIVGVVLAVICAYRRKWYAATIWLCGVVGSGAVVYILKHLFTRPRPELWDKLVVETGYSLPSGHATASMAIVLCVVVLLWHTKWRSLVVALGSVYVLLIGFSRLYLGVHYPTDILAGWVVTAMWVTSVVLLARKVRYIKNSLESAEKEQ